MDSPTDLAAQNAASNAWYTANVGNTLGNVQPTGSAAAQANANYLAYGRDLSNAQDVQAQQQLYISQYSQPRNDLQATAPSANFLALQNSYAQQHYATVGSSPTTYNPQYAPNSVIQNPQNAAQIAYNVALTGGTIGPSLAAAASPELGGTNLKFMTQTGSDFGNVIATPPKDVVSLPTYLPGSSLDLGKTVTTHVPYGNYAQEALPGSKILLGKDTGEIGVYLPRYDTEGNLAGYGLSSSGGRNAVQSGMFTIGEAETPFVTSREGAGTYSLPTGTGLSRLGAEAYGGYVTGLDNRTIEGMNKENPGSVQLSTYANPLNLANYVNPQGPNMSKTEAPGTNAPWGIGASSPAIQYMDANGVIKGSAVALPGILESPAGSTPASLPSPFTSKMDTAPALAAAPSGQGFDLGGWAAGAAGTIGKALSIPSGNGMGFGAQAAGSGVNNVISTTPAPFKSTYTPPATAAAGNGVSMPTGGIFDAFTSGQKYLASGDLVGYFKNAASESLQYGLRTAASANGNIGGGMLVDQAFATLKGDTKAAPGYNFAQSVSDIISPSQAEKNLVSPDTYKAGVSTYMQDLNAYKADLGTYNTKLGAYTAAGSSDQATYNGLVSEKVGLDSRMTNLSTEKANLDSDYSKVGEAPSLISKLGKAYEDLNQTLAPYTTDVVGIGRGLQSIKPLPENSDTMVGRAGQVANFTKGVVEDQYTHPVDIALWYGAGKAVGIGEHYLWSGVSKAAMAETPGLTQTAGRLLSTNEAVTLGQSAKIGVGAIFLGLGVKGAVEQPTSEEKGKAFGALSLAFIGGGAGVADLKFGPGVPNLYEYKTLGGERAVPLFSEVRADAAAKLNEWDLKYLQGSPGAADIYKNAYTASKEIRFEKSPTVGGNPVYEAINVPVEQQDTLAQALKPTSQFGSAAAHTQFPELSQEPDVRAVQTNMIHTEAFKNSPQWEKMDSLDYEPAFGNTGSATKSIMGSDIDAFGNKQQIDESLIGDKGSIVQVRQSDMINGQKTYLTEPSGAPATALVPGEKFYDRGYDPEDVVSISKGGAVFQIDVKPVPEGHPAIPGYIEPTTAAAPHVADSRPLLGTSLLGSPFESVPHEFDVTRGGSGDNTWMKENLGFQGQRLMESLEKNLAGSTERTAGDPFFRGNRLQKDTQRLLSAQEELLGAKRARLEVSSPNMKLTPTDASRMGVAEKALSTWRNTEFTYQTERLAPEGPPTGFEATTKAIAEAKSGGNGILDMIGRKSTPEKLPTDAFMESREYVGNEGAKVVRGTPQTLAETGMENYRMGLDIGGKEEQGPISTGVGGAKSLSEYPAVKASTAQDWLDRNSGVNPYSGEHATGGSAMKPTQAGKLLSDLPYQNKPTRLSIAEWAAKNGEVIEPVAPKTASSKSSAIDARDDVEDMIFSEGSKPPVSLYKGKNNAPTFDDIDTHISQGEPQQMTIRVGSPETSAPSQFKPFSPFVGIAMPSPRGGKESTDRATYATSPELPSEKYPVVSSADSHSIFAAPENIRDYAPAGASADRYFGTAAAAISAPTAPLADKYGIASIPPDYVPSVPAPNPYAPQPPTVPGYNPPTPPAPYAPEPPPPYKPTPGGGYEPTPPPPSPITPLFPYGGIGGGGGGGGGRKGFRRYQEYFPIGLDISMFGKTKGANPFTEGVGPMKYMARDASFSAGGSRTVKLSPEAKQMRAVHFNIKPVPLKRKGK